MITAQKITEAKKLSSILGCNYSEALNLILKSETNQILKDAFGVTDSNSTPKFLEGIAIALGLENK